MQEFPRKSGLEIFNLSMYHLTNRPFMDLLKLSLAPTLAIVMFFVGLGVFSEFLFGYAGPSTVGIAILVVLSVALMASFVDLALRGHRMIILNEIPSWIPDSSLRAMGTYVLRSIGIMLIAAPIIMVIMMVPLSFFPGITTGSGSVSALAIIGLVSGILANILLIGLSVTLPPVSISMKESFWHGVGSAVKERGRIAIVGLLFIVALFAMNFLQIIFVLIFGFIPILGIPLTLLSQLALTLIQLLMTISISTTLWIEINRNTKHSE